MAAPVYAITVGGIERDALLPTISIRDVANGLNTLSIALDSDLATYRPELDDEVEVTEDATVIFGGYITGALEVELAGVANPGIKTLITATDFNGLSLRRYVNDTIPAGTVKEALEFLDPYYTQYGVTLDGAQIDGPDLPELTYKWVKLTDVLNDLAQRTGETIQPLLWEIDYTKTLRMFDPSVNPAPFTLDEDADPAVQRGDVEVEPTRDDTYANRVIVVGGEINATGVVDTFTGNGVTTTFVLTHQLTGHRGYVVNNGVFQTLRLFGDPASFTYQQTTNSIIATVAPANGTVVAITYDGTLVPFAMAEDVSQQGLPRGIWERVVTSNAVFTTAGALALAQAILSVSISDQRQVRYETFELGLKAGQTQPTAVSKRNLSTDILIGEVVTTNEPESELMIRRVEAVASLAVQSKWQQLYQDWLNGNPGGSITTSGIAAPPNGTILVASLILTDAQIKALPSSERFIIASPGAGWRLVPIKAEIMTLFTAAYANLDGNAILGVTFEPAGSPATLGGKAFAYLLTDGFGSPGAGSPGMSTFLADMLDSGSRIAQLTPYTEPGPLPSVEDLANVCDMGIVVAMDNQGSGNMTGGASGNLMRVDVWYAVMPCLGTALFKNLMVASIDQLVWKYSSAFVQLAEFWVPPADAEPDADIVHGMTVALDGTVYLSVVDQFTSEIKIFHVTSTGAVLDNFLITADDLNFFNALAVLSTGDILVSVIVGASNELRRYSSVGVLQETYAVEPTIFAVSANDATLFYFDGVDGIVKRWNLTTDTALTDLYDAGGDADEHGIVALSDGGVLIAGLVFDATLGNINVGWRISSAGALVTTYRPTSPYSDDIAGLAIDVAAGRVYMHQDHDTPFEGILYAFDFTTGAHLATAMTGDALDVPGVLAVLP